MRAKLAKHPRLYSLLLSGKTTGLRLLGLDNQAPYRERARRIQAIEREVQAIEAQHGNHLPPPVLFFNPSSHLTDLSFNAAAGLVASWGLRSAGQPVVYLLCHAGLVKCVLGTNRLEPSAPPPCATCIANNNAFYPARHTVAFLPGVNGNAPQEAELASLSLQELSEFHFAGLPIGQLCLPSVRWILRRHDLETPAAGRQVLASYIVSAVGLAQELERVLNATRPRALLLFNGTFFPEAMARAVALGCGIPVTTYEGGFLPLSAFFCHGLATEWPIEIPAPFQMGPEEDAKLDSYLAQRFQGNFTMAGRNFWPEMKGVSPELKQKAKVHRRMVTVFTNTVFDTSQAHSSTIFDNMFEWLDETLRLAVARLDTLFVVRAHPDELRPGKESQEPVEQWLETRGYLGLPNLVFIPPKEYVSSYELVRLSQFCIVYNSTIGLEATLLGVPVVVGGLTRYSQERVTHAPASSEDYRSMVTAFLEGGAPPLPVDWQQRARRYMYYSLFRAALDLSAFVEPITPSSYTVRPVQVQALHPDHSKEMSVIYGGIVHGEPFHYR